MPGGYIGEVDIVVGADATGMPADIQKQANAQLAAIGKKLGQTVADSMRESMRAQAQKVAQAAAKPMEAASSAVRSATSRMLQPLQQQAGQAAAKLRTVGVNAKNGINDALSAAQRLPGAYGAAANVAVSSFAKARESARQFAEGFKDPERALTQASTLMQQLGGTARAAATSAGVAIKNSLGAVATGSLNALRTTATRTWDSIKSGAAAAARTAGQALKVGLGGAAKVTGGLIVAGIGTALAKGFKRLNDLNQAQARLEGIGISAKKAASVMKSVDTAVTGTAFGMGEAAQAAALLASSGVKSGQQMDSAMQAVVASAAGAGTSLDEISPIFQKIAASGKLSRVELSQLMVRGVNASGALQKSLGKNADEIKKMVSSGQIDFDTFTKAINSDLGLLAASMGGTLSGMSRNVLSAFGRVGAAVEKPIFEGLLVAMPSVLDFVKRLTKAIQKFMAPFEDRLKPAAEAVAKVLDGINFDAGGIGRFVSALGPLIPLLGLAAGAMGPMLTSIPLLGPMFNGLTGPVGLAAGALAAFALIDPSTMLEGFNNLAAGLPGIIGQVGAMLTNVLPGMISNLIGNIPVLIAGLSTVLTTALSAIVAQLPALLGGIATALVDSISSAASALPAAVNTITTQFSALIPQIAQTLITLAPVLIQAASDAIMGLASALPSLLQSVFGLIVNLAPQLLAQGMLLFDSLVQALITIAPQLIQQLVQVGLQLVQQLVTMLPQLLQMGIQLFTQLVQGVAQAIPQIIAAVVELLPQLIQTLVAMIPELLNTGITMLLSLVEAVGQAIPDIISALMEMLPQIIESLASMIPTLISAAIELFVSLATGLVQALPEIISTLLGMLPQLITTLVGMIPTLIEAAIQLFLGIVTGLAEALPQIITAVIDLLPVLIQTLFDMIPTLIDAGIQLFSALAEAIPEALGRIGEAIVNDLIPGIWNAITGQTPKAKDAGTQLMTGAAAGITGSSSTLSTAGSAAASAAAKGVNSKAGDLNKAGSQLGASAAAGLKASNPALQTSAAGLGQNAASSFDQQASAVSASAGKLGKSAAAGLTGQTGPMKKAGGDLGKAAASGISGVADATKTAGTRLGRAALNGFDNAKTPARNVGRDIAQGLANGISDGVGWVTAAADRIAQAAITTAKQRLDEHSPSKVFEQIGKFVGIGFAKGLGGTVDQVKAATAKMTDTVVKGFAKLRDQRKTLRGRESRLVAQIAGIDMSRKGAAEQKARLQKQLSDVTKARRAIDRVLGSNPKASQKAITDYIKKQNGELVKLAAQRENITARLKDRQRKLKEAIKLRDDFRASIRDSVVDLGNVAQFKSPTSMIRNLQKQVAATEGFQNAVTELRKLGLDNTTLQQLTEEFVRTGSTRAADALLAAGPEAVAEIAKLQGNLVSAGDKLGDYTSKALYQAGVDTAQGYVNGLVADLSKVDKAAEKIADRLVKTIKKKLGIKSPSRVMAALAHFTVDGFLGPISDRAREVAAKLEDLVTPPDARAITTVWSDLPGKNLPDVARPGGPGDQPPAAGVQTIINFAPGAIVVQGADDPEAVAEAVMDKIAEKASLGG